MTTTTMTTMIRPGRRLGGRTRKAFLLLHVVSGAAWFGIDLALGISVVIALAAGDPHTAGIAIQAVELFAIWPMFAASLLCLAFGVVLGLGSKYGLVRFWWVAVKLVLNVLMSTLIVVLLRPGIGEAANIGERLMAGDPAASVPAGLLFPVVVAPSMLLTAYLLSVFKPWGRVRRPANTTTGPATTDPATTDVLGAADAAAGMGPGALVGRPAPGMRLVRDRGRR